MVLYALKVNGEYVRDLKEQGWTYTSINKASVFPTVDDAKEIAAKVGSDTSEEVALISMKLDEKEIPWP